MSGIVPIQQIPDKTGQAWRLLKSRATCPACDKRGLGIVTSARSPLIAQCRYCRTPFTVGIVLSEAAKRRG